MSARDDRAEAMREACAEAVREIIDSIDDKGLFNKTEAACIRSTLRRAVSRIEALPLPATPADDASGAEAMREAARALFDLGCANGGDPGVVSYDSAEIHASLDRIFDKAWRDSPLRALPLPAAPAPDAVGEARDRFTEAALHAIGCRAAYGPNHPAAMNPSAKVREAWAALLAAERAQGEKGGDRG